MVQFDQTPSDNSQNLQPTTSPLLSRFQQARDDLISDLNALRKLRPTTNTTQNARPFSITLAAIATALYGCLYLLVILFLLLYLYFLDIYKYQLSSSILSAFFAPIIQNILLFQDLSIAAIFYCSFMGIAHLYVALGLWQCKYRAYWGIMGLTGLSILIQFFILTLLHFGGFFFMNIYIPLLIVVLATYGFHGAPPRPPKMREVLNKVSSMAKQLRA